MAPVTTVDGVCCFCRTGSSLTRPASQNKAKRLLGFSRCKPWLTSRTADRHYAECQAMANLLPMDVAQEAHFSNRDTRKSCQDGKQIKDVSTQSAKAPQSRGFLFLCSAHPCASPLLGLRAKTLLTFLLLAIHGSHSSGHRCASPFRPFLTVINLHCLCGVRTQRESTLNTALARAIRTDSTTK